MIDEDGPTFRAVSPRGWIGRTNYRDLAFALSFHAFVKQRDELLVLLEPLAEKDWSRTAKVRGAGKTRTWTVLSYVERLASHEHHHLQQFARIADTVRMR